MVNYLLRTAMPANTTSPVKSFSSQIPQDMERPDIEQQDTEPPQTRQMIAILDFGSQYSELIARRVRETQVYSEVLHYSIAMEDLRKLNPKGIILSGGPNSVYDPYAPKCNPEIWDLGVPVLGVCYGMQLMVQALGGKVEQADKGEYGKASLFISDPQTF